MAVVLMKLNWKKEVQFPEWDKMTAWGSLLGDKRKYEIIFKSQLTKITIYFTTAYVLNC